LIDHAWTYRVNEARASLIEHESLADRMCNLMNIKVDEEDEADEETLKKLKVDAILEQMWKYNQTYKISTDLLVKKIACKKFTLNY
jgi:tubulin--tyrosine ligase-like protein 12